MRVNRMKGNLQRNERAVKVSVSGFFFLLSCLGYRCLRDLTREKGEKKTGFCGPYPTVSFPRLKNNTNIYSKIGSLVLQDVSVACVMLSCPCAHACDSLSFCEGKVFIYFDFAFPPRCVFFFFSSHACCVNKQAI